MSSAHLLWIGNSKFYFHDCLIVEHPQPYRPTFAHDALHFGIETILGIISQENVKTWFDVYVGLMSSVTQDRVIYWNTNPARHIYICCLQFWHAICLASLYAYNMWPIKWMYGLLIELATSHSKQIPGISNACLMIVTCLESYHQTLQILPSLQMKYLSNWPDFRTVCL